MSATIAFDSHRFVKSLTASGFTEAQAEALAHEQIHLLEVNLATKSDLGAVKSDLEVQIETVRSDLEYRIEKVRSDLEVKIEQVRSDLEVKIEQVRAEVQAVKSSLLIWMAGALTAHLAVMVAVVQFLLQTA